MTQRRILITFYAIPLLMFIVVHGVTSYVELFGICNIIDNEQTTCTLWGRDLTWLYDRNNVVGYLASSNFFIFWILLGGGVLYYLDWQKKRASKC